MDCRLFGENFSIKMYESIYLTKFCKPFDMEGMYSFSKNVVLKRKLIHISFDRSGELCRFNFFMGQINIIHVTLNIRNQEI